MSSVLTGPMRLPFLILTPACVLVGVATAVYEGYPMDLYHLVMVFIGAIAAHISVNALNEYFDFKSGLDFKTIKTPFSGGSGTLPENPDMGHSALITGLISIGITSAVGIYFLYVRGFWLLPLGLVGIFIIMAYTKLITKNPIFCLIVPGLGFGPLMVMGTDFALTGSYSLTAFVASLVPFFLVSDLLLLNQFPDMEPDRAIGRKHIPIAIGRALSARVYEAFIFAAYLSVFFGSMLGYLPLTGMIALLSLVIAIPTTRGVKLHADDMPGLMPYMVKNVVINISTPVLLAIGIFLDKGLGS